MLLNGSPKVENQRGPPVLGKPPYARAVFQPLPSLHEFPVQALAKVGTFDVHLAFPTKPTVHGPLDLATGVSHVSGVENGLALDLHGTALLVQVDYLDATTRKESSLSKTICVPCSSMERADTGGSVVMLS